MLIAVAGAWAQEPAELPAEETTVADDSGPVTLPPPSELAMQRYRTGHVVWTVHQLLGILIPALFLFSGLSAKIRNWATGLGRWWFFIIAVYFIIFSLADYVIRLPWSYYAGFLRDHAYGLSNQTLQKWITDSALGLMVGIVMGVLFLWVPYLLLKKSPQRWWLYTGILVVPFLFFQMLVSPIWIAPLFNDFGPMENKELEAKILALAERAGIEDSRVYEVNKSVDTKAVNAYVTGFLDTKRIVLWDTLLDKLNEEEVLFVMGHEMGHYAMNHVVKFVLLLSVLIMAALYATHRLAWALIRRYKERFGFDQLHDIASLPLLMLILNVFSIILLPLMMGYSRYNERESDRFGIEITQDNRAAATAFMKLQQENLANPRPGPIFMFLRGTHPSIGQRVDFFNTYKPWETGEAMRYDHLFQPKHGPEL
jgi:Zn-dependent protease with chaperone function